MILRLLGPAVLAAAVLAALAFCCAAPALALQPAGDGWYWVSPQPQGHTLNDVTFGDASNAWAVGDAGVIMHSSDAGATWSPQSSPVTVPLGSVVFADARDGWAAGGYGWYSTERSESARGAIVHTTDGGVTWVAQVSDRDVAFADIAFAGDQQGWAVGGHGLILHTADGGETWTPQDSGVTHNLTTVAFADARHGYAAVADSGLIATKDGGATWTRLKSDLWGPGIGSLAVGPGGTIWATFGTRDVEGEFSRLACSTDGGRSWRFPRVSREDALWDVVALGDAVYATGPLQGRATDAGASQILVSRDAGTTWTRHIAGLSVEFGALACNGGGALCAVGNMTATSVDDGATWRGGTTHTTALVGVDMVGPADAWAVGVPPWFMEAGTQAADRSPLVHTSNGLDWAEAFSQAGEYFSGVDFADATHGWAVGKRGLIRRTADGGETWTRQSSGTTRSLVEVAAPTPDAAWVFGLDASARTWTATLLRTVDAGSTWTPLTLPTNVYAFALGAVSADRAWIGGVKRTRKGFQAVVLGTSDGGATWTRPQLPSSLGQESLTYDIDFVDATHGWCLILDLFGESMNTLLATSDGGATWSEVGRGQFGRDVMIDLDFVDAVHGWASGNSIYATSDGGATWTREVSGDLVSTTYLVSGFDASHALATGTGVLSTTDAPSQMGGPVTLVDIVGGWSRTSVAATLTASEVGASALASTEYRIDGGGWTEGLTPPPFLAPADHSGDGTHVLEYRSADTAGNVEPTQTVRVRVDTIKPATRLGRCVLGRDGVLRMHLRVNDRSCPSIARFGFTVRTLSGRLLVTARHNGGHLRTNKAVTVRDTMIGDFLGAGTYRIFFRATDRAGNLQTRDARAVLVVRPHKRPAWARQAGSFVVPSPDGSRTVYDLGGRRSGGQTVVRREVPTTAGERLIAELRRLVRAFPSPASEGR